MKILITGSCGFLGTNLVEHFCKKGDSVIGLDNLSRPGSEVNMQYLVDKYRNFRFIRRNIVRRVEESEVDVIFHMAGQVGVQASIKNPMHDYWSNVHGTLNVLEMARSLKKRPIVVFASTNKVYGHLYTRTPVDEMAQLSFQTPYGCSKGAADQYVLDYDRIYDVPGVVLRQSCIYGKYQLGAEEQGWVAWFMIAHRTKQPITIYGNGKQVRDILYIDDLVELYDKIIHNVDKVRGKAYNIGGGPKNTLSLDELVEKAEIDTEISYDKWRPADQKYYVSDIGRIRRDLDWEPKIGVDEGLKKLRKYVEERWPLRLQKLAY